MCHDVEAARLTIESLEGRADAKRPRLVVVPANQGGSVQHFYHFLFGYLLPFLEHCHALRATHRFLLRDCGPMNRLLRELDGFTIETIPTNLMLTSLVGTNEVVGHLPKIVAPGFDSPRFYALDRFMRCRAVMAELYRDRFAAAAARFPATASDRLVLLVERAPPDPFYDTAASENRSGGSARRSVPNMAELHAAIATRHDALLVRLEDCSLFEQIHLFSRAWRVVGQHGAGLAHMIWARSAGGLIEILPNPRQQPLGAIAHANFFQGICRRLDLPWHAVMQADQHAPVAPEEILAALG